MRILCTSNFYLDSLDKCIARTSILNNLIVLYEEKKGRAEESEKKGQGESRNAEKPNHYVLSVHLTTHKNTWTF